MSGEYLSRVSGLGGDIKPWDKMQLQILCASSALSVSPRLEFAPAETHHRDTEAAEVEQRKFTIPTSPRPMM